MRRDALSIPFWSAEEVHSALAPALQQLEQRKVLAYPTETVYGFGGAMDAESIASLVRLKRRPPGKPFLLLIDGSEMLNQLELHLSSYAATLAARHWPGPLTLVLPGGEGRVPATLRGPEGGIAVRWTGHAAMRELIRAHGSPVTSTSANRPGTPPAMSAREVVEQWPNAVAQGELRVLDGGRLTPSAASTVVDCMGRHARVIRPGAIPARVLRESVPALIGDA
jgi:L-threonylcarbamoyladenylate synthase